MRRRGQGRGDRRHRDLGSVSDEVDAKIRELIQARVFPVRLKAEDWASGETTWLLDVIAPSQKVATAVLANFKQVVKDKPVRIHPIVSQLSVRCDWYLLTSVEKGTRRLSRVRPGSLSAKWRGP
ncbi:toxin-activating lysine-acyltransferase [Bradyrhizobium sp. TM239]|uniref:toxin-activating lysine-acyltransferase n=1 Tax=Bradyrhizobium sp. TM239 TaxID=2599802 RepID=UPI0027D69210|nr:hypothetical protein TM239_65790 [Bradyrhizobium sp. TM239]